MKVTELSKKAMQFKQIFFYDSMVTESGMLIQLVEIDGWVRVMLEIGDKTTNQDIRDAAPLLLEWRDRLLDFQGAWNRGGKNHFLEKLSHMQEHGQSYARLAERLNKTIEEHIKGYLAYRQEVDAIHPELKAEHDKDILFAVFWLEMNSNSSTLSHAKSILEDLNFTQDDILDILQNGIKDLTKGESIFSRDYPISGKKVTEVLRTWRKGKLHLAIKKQEELEEQEFKSQRESKG